MELKPTKDYIINKEIKYTRDQLLAIDKIIKWVRSNDFKPFTLSGFAGTGKTTILKDIAKNMTGTVACTAPTHKAVRVVSNSIGIEGSTIQRLLGLRPNTDLDNFDINKPQFDPLGNIYIKNYRYIIIDECSMVNKDVFGLLMREATKYKVKLLFVGDPYQLPPVGEQYSKTFTAGTVFNLTQVVRQEDYNPLVGLLKLARDDVRNRRNRLIRKLYERPTGYNEELGSGYIIAKDDNHFTALIDDKFTSMEFESNIDHCRYTAFTNKSVLGTNKHIRHLLLNTDAVLTSDDLLTSYSTILNEFNSPIIVNSEDYIIASILNYNNKYLIKGYLVTLRKINGGDLTDTMFILDHSDLDNVNRYISIFNNLLKETRTNNLVKRRQAWENFFAYKNYNLLMTDVYASSGKLIASKDIDYGFGLTVHKTQGSTFENIFINVRDVIYNQNNVPYYNTDLRNRLLYVALSRASKCAFIYI